MVSKKRGSFYQYQFEVYLRYLARWRFSEYGTTLLVFVEVPAVATTRGSRSLNPGLNSLRTLPKAPAIPQTKGATELSAVS